MLYNRWAPFAIACSIAAGLGFLAWISLKSIAAANDQSAAGLYSQTRIAADQAWNDEKWQVAATHYHQLTLEDPLNGAAQARYGVCLVNLIDRDQPSAGPGGPAIPAASESDPRAVEAAKAFENGAKHRAYRPRCQYHAARLCYLLGDHGAALDMLEGLVEDGNTSGLLQESLLEDFPALIDDPAFQAIYRVTNPRRVTSVR